VGEQCQPIILLGKYEKGEQNKGKLYGKKKDERNIVHFKKGLNKCIRRKIKAKRTIPVH
jgi:hypothetical protein